MCRTLLLSLLASLFVATPLLRADDLEERRQREKVAAQALEHSVREAVKAAKAMKDDAPAALKVLDDALIKLNGDMTLEIAKRAELRHLVESTIKEIKNPKTNQRPSLMDRLPPSRREVEEKLKAQFEQILELQKQGKYAEAAQATNKVLAEYPGLLAAEQNKTVLDRGQSVNDARAVQENKGRSETGAMTDLAKSSIPTSGDVSYPPGWKEKMDKRKLALEDKLNPRSTKEKELLKQLSQTIAQAINFKDMPFEQALKVIQEETGLSLLVNKRSLDELRIDYATPVSLNVPRGASKRAVLTALLEQLGMAYIIKNEQITLISKEEASKTLVTRVFQVDTLVGAGLGQATPEALVRFIEDNIEPESWKRNSGAGTIVYVPAARVLIVKNTSEVISKLEGLK